MSTIKVNKLESTSTIDGGIQLDSDGHVTVDGQQLPTAGPLSSRRINVNGAMQVCQRSTSVTGLSSSNTVRAVDRMFIRINGAGTFTVSQSTEAPDGFTKSIKWDCTTADNSPGASDFAYMAYKMEGRDVQHLKKGTSSALKTTVSFWVRSSETGTYAFRLVDHDNSRQVGLNYTIDTADTWEFKTLTLPGDTSGVLGDDAGNSLSLFWWLVVGSNRTAGSLPTAWEAQTVSDEAAGMTANIAASTNSDFYLTGLQFEVGEKATPFEYRNYSDELARCQRYFQTSFNSNPSTTNTDNKGVAFAGGGTTGNTTSFIGGCYVQFAPTMRSAPTVTIYDLASPRNTGKTHRHTYGSAGSNNSSGVVTDINTRSFIVRSDSGANASGIIFHWKAEAEL
jgi:hypothetical protein